MRKAKIAAIIFGGVSTCLCGGILGVYSTSSVVSSVAPKNEVENIYNVESEKLANIAAVTSIRTTAVTTTSTDTTTTATAYVNKVPEKFQRNDDMINLIVTSEACSTTDTDATTTKTTVITTTASIINEEDIEDAPVYSASLGNLTISGPFIADNDEDATEDDTTEISESESEEDFDFDPSTDYVPPAVEYIAPVIEKTTSAETTTETTTTETTTTTTAETTTETETTTTTTTVETTTEATTTTAETTTVSETETTTTTVATTETSAETSTTTTVSAAFVITTSFTVPEDETTTTTTTNTSENGKLPVSDADYILLCNAVANEAGSNWITTYDKGKVVEVIMNRVNSSLYPDTIFGVISQPYQFEGSERYMYLTDFSSYVTDDVKAAVELYFNESDSFAHNYFGFYGDGYQNYFY